MRKGAMAAVVFGVLALTWANEAAAEPTSKLTRNELRIACEQAGGVFGDAVLGVSYCFFPDGSVIICSGSTGKCDHREPRRGEFEKFLSSIVATQGAILSTQQKVLVDLSGIVADLGKLQATLGDLHSACAPPDLVPLPREGSAPPDFCRTPADASNNLIVRVKNQGFSDAGPSTLRVTFTTTSGLKPVDVPVPALNWGTFLDLSVPIPADCPDPDPHSQACRFQIAVDVADVVAESDEPNNNVAGVCAPIF
jgi:hypothetical protein